MNGYMTAEDTLRFKSEMVRAGYTIGTLAKALKVNRKTLSSRINGEVDFTRTEMEQISSLLSMPPGKIFFAA
jgi:plasmid maintenance system antidote protein VapI